MLAQCFSVGEAQELFTFAWSIFEFWIIKIIKKQMCKKCMYRLLDHCDPIENLAPDSDFPWIGCFLCDSSHSGW